MGGVQCAVENYINSMVELQTTMDNFQKTILAEVSRLVEYQSNWVPDGDSLRAHNGPYYAPDDPTLPQPWKGVIDGSSGSIYYWNTETNTTQYEKPKPVFFLPTDHHHCASAPHVPNTNYHHKSSLTHPTLPHPSHQISPFPISAHPTQSDYDYLYPPPYLADQFHPYDPYPNTPHSSPCPSVNYPESPQPILDTYAMPNSSLTPPPSSGVFTSCGGFNIEKREHSKASKLKLQLIRAHYNLKPRAPVSMKRKRPLMLSHRRPSQLSKGLKWEKWGVCYKARSIVPTTPNLVLPSDMLLDSISPPIVLDDIVKHDINSTDESMFTLGMKTIVTGTEGFAKFSEGNCSYPSNDPSCQPHSLVDESLMDLGNMPEEKEQSAIVHHFHDLVVNVDNFSKVTNPFFGLKPIWLSMSFVESPVCLEVSIPASYEHGSKHETVEFDQFMVCSFTVIELVKALRVAHFTVREKNVLSSSKGDFEYDVHLANFIESLSRNSQKFFVNMHGRGIERQCSVMYHCLLSYLNWDQKSISDAFLSHEFFVPCVTMKFLLSEFCKSGSKFQSKALLEASLENMDLKVVICAHWKVMDYTLHLVGALAIETVGRPISAAVVDNENLCGSLIVLELLWGLLTVAVPFAAIKQLLVIGINSTSSLTAPIEDFCNNKLLVCSLITTTTNRNFWGQFISLDKSNSDSQLKLRAQSIFCVDLQLMDRSCILHTAHKQSHFLVQLQTISGIIPFPILEQHKKTYRVICFVILVEGYLMNCFLSSEDQMSAHWSNKSSKFGACMVHERSQCMYNMMISPKLDDISWNLVVIKIVKVVLKEDANFYYYDKWAISLVVLHFGCRSFFFPYECVGHFRTDAENPTIINRGVKYGNMFSCTMTIVTLGYLKLHGLLEIDDDEAAHNAWECLTGLLHHDTEVYFEYFLGIPEIYVAWNNTKSLPVFYINLSNRIFDEDLEYIMKTLVSTDATVLRSTTWNVVLIFHGSHCQAFSLWLSAMTPKPFYTATVAAKVRPGETTLLTVPSAIFSVTKIALGHHNPFLEQVDALLNFHSMVLPLRCCSAYFIVRSRVIFGGIHTANKLGILQTGQEEYNVHSYMNKVNAHRLLILNPSEVVVKMGLLTLSTYFKLIFALVMTKRIVDAEDMIEEVLGKVTVHDVVPFIILTTGSCGYWNAKQAKAKGFHAIVWGVGVQSTENLINEDPSNVVAHTKAPWLQLEDIWFNFPLAQF